MAESSTSHVQGSSQSIAVGQKRETASNGETKAVLLATMCFSKRNRSRRRSAPALSLL